MPIYTLRINVFRCTKVYYQQDASKLDVWDLGVRERLGLRLSGTLFQMPVLETWVWIRDFSVKGAGFTLSWG